MTMPAGCDAMMTGAAIMMASRMLNRKHAARSLLVCRTPERGREAASSE